MDTSNTLENTAMPDLAPTSAPESAPRADEAPHINILHMLPKDVFALLEERDLSGVRQPVTDRWGNAHGAVIFINGALETAVTFDALDKLSDQWRGAEEEGDFSPEARRAGLQDAAQRYLNHLGSPDSKEAQDSPFEIEILLHALRFCFGPGIIDRVNQVTAARSEREKREVLEMVPEPAWKD
jgi:hypothetical protein